MTSLNSANPSAQTTRQQADAMAMGFDTWRRLAYVNPVEPLPKGLDAWWHASTGRLRHARSGAPRLMRFADEVCRLSGVYRDMSSAALREALADSHAVYRRGREDHYTAARAFAQLREAARRTLGMEPYPVQIAASKGLTEPRFIELATGEGKSLVGALSAVVAGWRGRGCHVLTVNDYLAERDTKLMAPFYAFCGLRADVVTEAMEPAGRRAAYAADITYTTNKSVTADYLRDRLALGRLNGLTDALLARRLRETAGRSLRGRPDALVMRSLDTAIVDEADSILIDEAVTPLIISTESTDTERIAAFSVAADLALNLHEGEHFTINRTYREIDFTRMGRQQIEELCNGMEGYWQSVRLREELVNQALSARHLFLRDQQYVVADGKIVIVDESTGRLMPDRSWRAGMHQAVEAKEGVEITAPKDTLARISFQRFFRGYHRLSGMSGTGWEARHELWQNYELVTTCLPTHRPCIRAQLPERIYPKLDTKYQALIDHVQKIHETDRPVLIGTRSVESSEQVSRLLAERGLEHSVLNAIRHEEEAQIVSQAGRRQAITVATNMAGRGTDIKLDPGVADLGGLHVVSVERNDSRRIDRQLFGRAGRQGDPGSAVAFSSLEDGVVKRYDTRMLRWMRLGNQWAKRLALDLAQKRSQRLSRESRRQVSRMDDQLNEQLGFSGKEH